MLHHFLGIENGRVLEIVFLYLVQENIGQKKGQRYYELIIGKRKEGRNRDSSRKEEAF